MAWTDNEGRYYLNDLGKFWSSTTILSLLDKSNALIPWAARLVCDKFLEDLQKFGKSEDGNVIYLPAAELPVIAERARGEWRRKRDEAADIGSVTHGVVESYCRWLMDGAKGPWAVPGGMGEKVENAVRLFKEWAGTVELEPLAMEIKVVSPRHEYGGRLDLIARGYFDRGTGKKGKWRKKRTYLIDTKTSKGFYDTYGPQVSSYFAGYTQDQKSEHKLEGVGIIRIGKEDGVPEFRDYTDHHEINFARFLALKEAYILFKGRPK